MRKKIACTLLLIFFLFNRGNSAPQHFYVKSNILNWVFLRPSVGFEYLPDKKNSIGIHVSSGSTFWEKDGRKPYYKFNTALIDYNKTIHSSRNERYQFRMLGYAGYIHRDFYKEEKLWESGWYIMRIKKGRDFSGDAIRLGIGLSNVFKPCRRISFEQSFGLGWGTYFRQSDAYYTPSKTNYPGFVDVRFAINFCYSIF